MKEGPGTSGYIATRFLNFNDIGAKVGENFSTNNPFFIC